MGKNKKRGNKEVADVSLKSMKQGFVQKKKNQKFKRTPAGKVALINGSNKQNNSKQQNGKSLSPQKSPLKNNENNKNLPNNDKKQQQLPQKQLNKKKVQRTEEDDDSESDEDINEGIVIQEENSFADSDDIEDDDEDESDEDESDEDDVPNILGASLAENSDDDDEDFEEEDADDVAEENKGVKKFKGVPSESDSDNDLSSDEDMSGTDLNTSSSLMNSEFDSDEDDYDDEEEEEEEGEEDDDEESDESDDEEVEGSELGLKTLVAGRDITDDEDDEDFDGTGEDDEDEDISDEDDDEEDNAKSKENKKKNKEIAQAHKDLIEKSTIYVGNIPKEVKKSQLFKLFQKFGKIMKLRIRGAIPENPKMSKRVAVITKKIHPKIKTFYAYITFEEEASAEKALSMNGTKFAEHYLRVDKAAKPEDIKYDPKKCVFVGNLSFCK